MCAIIFRVDGTSIETPAEFEKEFGVDLTVEDPTLERKHLDCCLCVVDVEKLLTKYGIAWQHDAGDYQLL